MNRKLRDACVLVATFLALLSVPSFGQVLKGSISGTAVDPQGAVVPGAQVKATNTGTGISSVTTTDNSGSFRFNLLSVGDYKIEVSSQNFKTAMQDHIMVSAGRDSGLSSIRLAVGETNSVMEVSGDVPLIETTQSQVSNTFTGVQLSTFSGVQENEGLDSLALFIPGVINTRSDTFSNTNGTGFSNNGLRGRTNDEEIDGQNNNDNSLGGASLFVTDTNFVQQYVLVTSNFGPEYGRNGGSVVNVITNSGNNAWHGSGYGIENNSSLNALSNLQRNSLNPATADAANPSGTPFTEPPHSNTEFSGFTVGGPLAKNKVFIFSGFDNQITSATGTFASSLLTPTPAGLATLAACPSVDPAALHVLTTYGPYGIKAGNPQPFKAPVLQSLAGCNGVETAGVLRSLPTPAHAYNVIQRFDAQHGDDSFSGRYLFSRDNIFNRNDNAPAGYVFNQSAQNQAILFTWTRNFNTRMVNELRAGFDRLNIGFGGNTIGNTFEPTQNQQNQAVANISFLDASLGFGTAPNLPEGRIVNTWQGQDNWTYLMGKHQLKAGVNFTAQISPNVFLPFVNGQFAYTGLSDFLSNQSFFETVASGPNQGFKEYDTFLYVGDDWKISRDLTLNLGLTWTYYGNPANVFHDASLKRESDPATAIWATTSDLNGSPVPLAARVDPQINNVYKSFGPSIGFAYSPQWGGFLTGNGKTTFRGGYRLLYDPPVYNIYSNIASSAPFISSPFIDGPARVGPSSVAVPIPADPTGPNVRAALGAFLQPGQFDPRGQLELILPQNFGPDKVHSWSFGVQREITKNSAFEARYVGNHAVNVFQAVNGNPFFTDLQAAFPTQVPAGMKACSDPNTPFPGRPDCNFGLEQQYTNGAFSNYNALQLEFRANNLFKQLTVRTGYTWSKTLDNTSEIFSTGTAGNTQAFAQNPTQTGNAEYSISGLNVPKAWTISFYEQVPFFKEQHGIIGRVLGGWAVSADYILASGQPYTPIQNNEEALATAGGDFYDASFVGSFVGPDVARPFSGNPNAAASSVAIYAGDARSACGQQSPPNPVQSLGVVASQGCANLVANPTISNTQLLSLNSLNQVNSNQVVTVTNAQARYIINMSTAQSVFGTPFGNVPRNSVSDAPQNIGNFSLFKNVKLTERVNFEMHATALNAFNHFNFTSVDPTLEHAGLGGTPGSGTGFGLPFVSSASGRTLYVGGKITF